MVDHKNSTYGELIDFLNAAELESEDSEQPVAEIITEKFRSQYPDIPIHRPSRFLDTVRRLAAPTKPSAIGRQKFVGSPLRSYLHRHWVPRTRNEQGIIIIQPCITMHMQKYYRASTVPR